MKTIYNEPLVWCVFKKMSEDVFEKICSHLFDEAEYYRLSPSQRLVVLLCGLDRGPSKYQNLYKILKSLNVHLIEVAIKEDSDKYRVSLFLIHQTLQ